MEATLTIPPMLNPNGVKTATGYPGCPSNIARADSIRLDPKALRRMSAMAQQEAETSAQSRVITHMRANIELPTIEVWPSDSEGRSNLNPDGQEFNYKNIEAVNMDEYTSYEGDTESQYADSDIESDSDIEEDQLEDEGAEGNDLEEGEIEEDEMEVLNFNEDCMEEDELEEGEIEEDELVDDAFKGEDGNDTDSKPSGSDSSIMSTDATYSPSTTSSTAMDTDTDSSSLESSLGDPPSPFDPFNGTPMDIDSFTVRTRGQLRNQSERLLEIRSLEQALINSGDDRTPGETFVTTGQSREISLDEDTKSTLAALAYMKMFKGHSSFRGQ